MQELFKGYIGSPMMTGLQPAAFRGGEQSSFPDIAYTDHGDTVDGTNQTTYDFTNISTTRESCLLCIASYDFGPSFNVSSVVLDPSGSADSFTQIASSSSLDGSSINHRVSIYGLLNTSLSTATIRVTHSESILGCAITVISVDDLQSLTPEDTQTDSSGVFDTLSAASTGGIALCMITNDGNNATSWSGHTGTELNDTDVEGRHYSSWISAASYDGSTVTASASGNIIDNVGVVLR